MLMKIGVTSAGILGGTAAFVWWSYRSIDRALSSVYGSAKAR